MTTSKQQSVNNPWFGATMVLAGVIGGYVIAVASGQSAGIQPSAPSQPAPQPTQAANAPAQAPAAPTADNVDPVDVDDDNIRGDKNATVSVIEYSDFECPFCQRHHGTMKQLIEQEDDVNWVYRHYPLAFHPNAQKSAEASECAAEQGVFWEFADMIFDKGLNPNSYVAYAEEAGADGAEFEECLNSGKYADMVKEQMAAGSTAGVKGTPGNIIINNETGEARLVSGAQPLTAFLNAIEEVR